MQPQVLIFIFNWFFFCVDIVTGEPSCRNHSFLTNEQRRVISHLLLQSIEHGKLKSRTIV